MPLASPSLFAGQNIGLYLDKHEPLLMKKKKDADEVHMLGLRLRVQPLTPELATLLPGVHRVLFNLTTGDPVDNLLNVAFNLAIPPQQLHIAMAPDDQPALMLDHVKVSHFKARTEKGVDGWALTFRALFGPVTSQELEYVHAWFTQQRFVTCVVDAEPSLFDGLDDEPADDPDEDEGAPIDGRVARPAPMWQDGDEQRPADGVVGDEAARTLPLRHPRAVPVS